MSQSEMPAATEVAILMVDDRPDDLLALEAILGDLGHRLIKATSGTEALRLLSDQDFAAVLLDVRMDGLDGFTIARRIRDSERSRHTPIIFLTAHDDGRAVVEAYSLGAVDYLVKPLVPTILRAKVAVFVDLYRKAAQVRRQAELLRQTDRREFEQRLAEENARLRQSEDRFRSLIEHSYDAVCLIDAAGIVRYASPATTRILGYPTAAFVGRNVFEMMHPEDLPPTTAVFARLLGTPHATATLTFRFRHQSGSWRWIEGTGTNLLEEPGVGAVVANYHDVTDRQHAEEQLRRRAEQLAEADRRKDEFLAMLAHELRNPLAPIRNALHLLRRPDTSGPDAARALELMERQTRTLVRLVDDMLDVSRITRGKVRLRTEPVELADVLRRAVDAARPLIEANRHTLTLNLAEPAVRVVADATRLEQVFANLLNNAAKYTERGGQIHVREERQGDTALVRVRDTGFGIPATLLPHVFDLFTQADRTLDRAQGGLGIGLTLVKTLVELHGGSVEAHSDGPGKGSEFIVRLPVAATPTTTPTAAALAAAVTPCAAAWRVLVVEDNQDAADSLAMLLRLWGHEVRTAHDGQSGLKAARSYRPDIVLLDIGLPGLDGYAVARRLRSEFGPAVRLVAMTGYGQDEDRRRASAAGFDTYLTKPADPAALQAILAGIPARV